MLFPHAGPHKHAKRPQIHSPATPLHSHTHTHTFKCTQIDWHDFVVVETIDFHDDEDPELPPPLTYKDVVALSRVGVGVVQITDTDSCVPLQAARARTRLMGGQEWVGAVLHKQAGRHARVARR